MTKIFTTNHPHTPTEPRPSSCSLLFSRIVNLVSKIFLAIGSLFSRYFGSKLNCGYKFEFDKTLSQDEAAFYLPYVSIAAYSFCGKADEFVRPLGWTPIPPNEIQFKDSELLPTDYAYFDPKTGLKISFAEKGDEILFAIPGLIFSQGGGKNEKERNLLYGLLRDPAKGFNLLGGVPYVYSQAERVISSLLALERFKGKRVTLVGQCFGGSVASYVALKKAIPATCINSFQIGAGLQAEIGDETLKKADHLITHICVERDWITGSKSIEMIDRMLTSLRIRTPGNFGKKYLIPSAYQSASKSHGFVLGSLMAYLGHHKRATPRSLVASGIKI